MTNRPDDAPPTRSIPEWDGGDARAFRDEVISRFRPVVLRGLVGQWPAVAAARQGAEAAAGYLAGFDRGAAADVFVGPAAMKGRFFYNDDLAGFNFERRREPISGVLARLLAMPEANPPASVYMGSTPAPTHLPGFAQANPAPLLPAEVPPRLWIGNAHQVAAHYDLSDNIACVVSGRRRFTLFPPDQVANLYVGPIDHTVAGQPTSLVSASAPDLDRFPRYRDALAAAMTADLEPGDAIYIPSLWWHAVQSFGRLNVLVNYWWEEQPAGSGSGFDALVHALWAIADLPPARREAWRAMFEHYVFRTHGDPAEHIPADRRGVLGASSPELRRRFRAFLQHALNRP